jgi:hypothetical protein
MIHVNHRWEILWRTDRGAHKAVTNSSYFSESDGNQSLEQGAREWSINGKLKRAL